MLMSRKGPLVKPVLSEIHEAVARPRSLEATIIHRLGRFAVWVLFVFDAMLKAGSVYGKMPSASEAACLNHHELACGSRGKNCNRGARSF